MAKETSKEVATRQQLLVDTRDIAKAAAETPSASIVLDSIEAMPNENFLSISGEYLELKENTTYNMVITGMTEIPNSFKNNDTDPDTVQAVQFYAKDEKGVVTAYITSEKVLRSSVWDVMQKNVDFPLQARVYTKTRITAGKGKYLQMSVTILPPTRA